MDLTNPIEPVNLPEVLGLIAQKLLRIDTLKAQGRDALDFHDVGVGSLSLALEAAFRAGHASGQAGGTLPLHAPAYDDAPASGVDHLSGLLRTLGVEPASYVEAGYPQDRADYEQQRAAGTIKRRSLR